MKLPVCCVRDQLTGYLNPFTATNEDVAKRDFKIAINDRKAMLYHNPSHFDLYLLGSFDTELGHLEPCDPSILLTGLSVWEKDNEVQE